MHIINSIHNDLSQQESEIIIDDLYEYDLINEKEAKLLKVAISDKVLSLGKEYRDSVRTRLLKNMMVNLI